MKTKKTITSKKVIFETLGCRYNRYETAEMAYELSNAGYAEAAQGERSDVVVINTCSVTAKSDARCRAAIRKAHNEHPGARVIVVGCYVDTDPETVTNIPGVDLVLGNVSKFELATALKDLGDEPVALLGGDPGDILAIRPVTSMSGRTNAYLNVQGGCDEICSFCIVRLARGHSRSADPDEVVAQVGRMSEAGIKEVVLSGVNLGDYFYGGEVTFARLLARILDETKMERIRLSSINPNTVSDELIDVMASSSRVCRHLHIPLQSGSDSILRKMRRPYTAKDFEDLLDRLITAIPDIGLGADLLVAFPGEGKKEFAETYELIERSPVMMLHVFNYSCRPNTEAASMHGRVDAQEAKRRSAALKKLSAEKATTARKRFTGTALPLLVENKRDRDGYLKGFTDNYLPVRFVGPDEIMNHIVQVRLMRDDGKYMFGERTRHE